MPSRSHFLAGMMLAIALLATVLVIEAYRAVRTHKATARQVLVDYTALAAQGSAARLQNELAPKMFPILATLRELPATPLARLPELLPPRSIDLARKLVWAGPVGLAGSTATVSDSLVIALPSALYDSMRAISARLPDEAYFATLRVDSGYVVFTPMRGGVAPVAMMIPRRVFTELVQATLTDVMILPSAIAKGDSLDHGLGATVFDADQMLANRGYSGSTPFNTVQTFSPMFGNLSLHVRIAEALAPQLVIGGLPKSRVPLLSGILVVTLLLATAGIIQAQQERRLVRLREDVVAGASHELRTPLAQIRLFAETLRLGRVRTEEERERALAVIEREARRLEHLVDNLLHTSRSERGGIHLALESLDLTALTRQIVDEFAPLADKSGVRVEVLAEAAVIVAVDPAAWRQVLVNLLDNAVKYGGRDAVVVVEVQALEGSVVVLVTDAGPGVANADHDKVWQRFWRGQAAVQSGTAGSGLGLATVRDLVTLHGGSCEAVQRAGTGATFRVELPR